MISVSILNSTTMGSSCLIMIISLIILRHIEGKLQRTLVAKCLQMMKERKTLILMRDRIEIPLCRAKKMNSWGLTRVRFSRNEDLLLTQTTYYALMFSGKRSPFMLNSSLLRRWRTFVVSGISMRQWRSSIFIVTTSVERRKRHLASTVYACTKYTTHYLTTQSISMYIEWPTTLISAFSTKIQRHARLRPGRARSCLKVTERPSTTTTQVNGR